ncbi:MAG: site-2 protease family protein [Elusimicrobia bacterium]|nr:site-2 protease family protein [Elusimicrobiota bacterium]
MELILQLPILLFSIIFHEVAHGRMALLHGDDTALRHGRLTFNPAAHIDPVGTVILPLICFWGGWPMFGWAKPVPVDPFSFHRPRKGLVQVAAAGPLSNLLLCVAAAVVLRLTLVLPGDLQFSMRTLRGALWYAMNINLALAFFNLVPVHPLDGSKILSGLLPLKWSLVYESHAPYGVGIILALIFLRVLGPLVSVPAGVFQLLLLKVLGMA